MKVGELIKQIKFNSELNQSEIAEILGCSQVSVSRLRRDMQFPDAILLTKIIKLAKRYKIKVEMDDVLENK